MRRRLVKESRPLLLPWAIAVLASPAAIYPWGEFVGHLLVMSLFTSIALFAALAFGTEFQQRTLPLLLSQPIARIQLWREKLLVLAIGAGLVVVINGGIWLLVQRVKGAWDMFPTGSETLLFTLTAVCSAGFWTLMARSTIGGLVFTLSSQILALVLIPFAVEKIFGIDTSQGFPQAATLSTGCLAYSAAFLFLGWRKFAHLELREAIPAEGMGAATSGPGTRRAWSWLICRPRSPVANLIRKEFRLQKPLFLLAAVFSACWLVTLTALSLDPSREKFFVIVLNVLTGFCLILIPLLAGCISLGEEKALGLSGWHLTLPISTRQQWLAKLAVGVMVAFVLGLALPFVLAVIAPARLEIGLRGLLHSARSLDEVSAFLLAAGAPFLLSFWAVTLLGNVVRAVLATVIALPLLFGCAALGVWGAGLYQGLQSGLVIHLMAQFQLPANDLIRFSLKADVPATALLSALSVLIVLGQSLAQFRRTQVRREVLVKYSAILAGFILLSAFWLTDTARSLQRTYNSPLQQDLYNAVLSLTLPRKDLPAPGDIRVFTYQDLDRTGRLSELTKKWLKDSSVEFTTIRVGGVGLTPVRYLGQVRIVFPNGSTDLFQPRTFLPSSFISPPPSHYR